MVGHNKCCWITNLVVIIMLIDPANCDEENVFSNGSYNFEAVDIVMNRYVSFEELVSNGSYNFEAADTDNNRYVSFEELARYVLKQQSLDKNTSIEHILLHATIFYQHDFNDDGKLSIFEWKRGEELISVISRVLLGN